MHKNPHNPRRYDDIIGLSRPVSQSHPPMPMSDRAAQFSPFAALTGYGDAIREEARLTDSQIELDENRKEELNQKLLLIQEQTGGAAKSRVPVRITYFRPDERKSGGSYLSLSGYVRRIDLYEGMLVMEDGERVAVRDIVEIEI
ncbi:MAG TPA: YolD-like family protein [Candidatus Enterocloster excrementipullorum]|uniref:YolD-like family protein n=1 Tax=Candidatus Enterocloster excrementipullorum TaxID=2838559 RepID=A0A9D2N0Z1_9FIRM|nr:YolD-like family protein [Candidatus Enterocloster excrementipullorum]